jgi:hypothetical protein
VALKGVARSYWIGLSLFWVGAGLWLLPTGNYRLFTVLAGLSIQVAGSLLMVRTLLVASSRSDGNDKAMRSRRTRILAATSALFVVGLLAGMRLGCSTSHPAAAPSSTDGQDDEHMRALCRDPVQNGDAARWFAGLPVQDKRAHAAKAGVILLETSGGQEFAFGCGAAVSPYPWVFSCSDPRLEVSGDNAFVLAYRDDELVKATWGAHWTWGQSYDVLPAESGPLFAKRPPGKGQAGGDLWIPATSWKYVGPQLERSNTTLKATDVNRGP